MISIEGLQKRYGAIQALVGLDLEIPRGAVGLLGPNGAGKSTLLKLLLGLLEPDGGRARIAGFDPAVSSDRRQFFGADVQAQPGLLFQARRGPCRGRVLGVPQAG